MPPTVIEAPALLALNQIWKMTEEVKNNLAANGIHVETGRWTATEKKLLRENAEQFASMHKMEVGGTTPNHSGPRG